MYITALTNNPFFLLLTNFPPTHSELITGKSPEHIRKPRHDLDGISALDFQHHDYARMEKYLQDLHEKYPEITRLSSIGKSVEGRELYVLEITQNPGKHIPGKSNLCISFE